MKKVTPEYQAWANAKSRCYNPKVSKYENHGGRGIKMCDRWKNDFKCFLLDMGLRPSGKSSLDRIDNDGDYTPSNCRWASWTEQNNNTRKNLYLTYEGVTLSLRQWSKKLSIPKSTIQYRLLQGYPTHQVLSTIHFKTGPKENR